MPRRGWRAARTLGPARQSEPGRGPDRRAPRPGRDAGPVRRRDARGRPQRRRADGPDRGSRGVARRRRRSPPRQRAWSIVDRRPSGAKAPGQPKLAEAIRSPAASSADRLAEGGRARRLDRQRGPRPRDPLAPGRVKELARADRWLRPRGRRRTARPDAAGCDGARQARPVSTGRPVTTDDVAELVAEATPSTSSSANRPRK